MPKPDRRWSALALIVTAQFMVILDVAIVNVALPSIKTDLGFSRTGLQWVITAYAIIFGGPRLLGGRLADLLGRRRMFVAGLALFALSSLLCGFAWSSGSLVGFRALQGLGGALLAPAALSLLMTTFAEGRERNLALGIYGAASGSGAAAGVLLGGVLTSYFGWSWEFFVLTLYVQDVLHYSAVQSGVAFVAFALSVVVASNLAQAVVARVGVRATLTSGLVLAAISLGLLTRLPVDGQYFSDLFPAFVLGGTGLGF